MDINTPEHVIEKQENVTPSENPKVRLMRSSLQDTVAAYVMSIRLSWFGRAYPDLYHSRRQELRNIHQAACSQLKKMLEMEIDEILQEQDLLPKISQLNEIVKSSNHLKGTTAWRPSKKPSLDLDDHFEIPQMKYLEGLQAYLHVLKSEDSSLERELDASRKEVQKKAREIEDMTQSYIKINNAIKELDMESLQNLLSKSNKVLNH